MPTVRRRVHRRVSEAKYDGLVFLVSWLYVRLLKMVASTSSELPAGCQALEGSTAAVAAPSLPHHAPTTDLYNRFSAKKKTYILASLSLAGVLGRK